MITIDDKNIDDIVEPGKYYIGIGNINVPLEIIHGTLFVTKRGTVINQKIVPDELERSSYIRSMKFKEFDKFKRVEYSDISRNEIENLKQSIMTEVDRTIIPKILQRVKELNGTVNSLNLIVKKSKDDLMFVESIKEEVSDTSKHIYELELKIENLSNKLDDELDTNILLGKEIEKSDKKFTDLLKILDERELNLKKDIMTELKNKIKGDV